jgi:hypothetical protein
VPVHTHIEIIDNGPKVACDICGADYTDRNDCGGFLFDTYAYCPTCAVKSLPEIKKFGEERFIRSYCPPNMKFRDWVLRLRDGDNTVKIIRQSFQ